MKILFSAEKNTMPKTRLRGNHFIVDIVLECENLVTCVG